MYYNPMSVDYWFNPYPDSLAKPILYTLVILGILALVFSYYGVKYYSKLPAEGKFKKWWKKMETFLATTSLITLFLCFCSYELIPYIRAKIVFLVWPIIVLIWLSFLIKRRIIIQKRVDQYLTTQK